MIAAAPSSRRIPWTLVAVVAAFICYFSMYAFRKPFAALAFPGTWLGDLQLKTALVTAQLIGYVTAKFLGTRVCSALHRRQVPLALVTCIGVAWGALALLPVVPAFWTVAPMALNGLALGMVFGMVMRPLEGRGNSEFLLAGLCSSFIIASAAVKDTGNAILGQDWFGRIFGDERWMPFATGLVYLLPFLAATWCLGRIPLPSAKDVADRSERPAMDRHDRLAFIRNLAGLLIPLAILYILLTAFRDYRDNFQAELFAEVGLDPKASKSAFTRSETLVAFAVVAVTSLVILVRRHLRALQSAHAVMALSITLPAIALLLRKTGAIDGMTWMILSGIGAYIPYILIHCVIFERLIALTRSPGNSVFAMMLFDTLGYLGPIVLIPAGDQIASQLATANGAGGGSPARLPIFDGFAWLMAVIGVLAMAWCLLRAPAYRPEGRIGRSLRADAKGGVGPAAAATPDGDALATPNAPAATAPLCHSAGIGIGRFPSAPRNVLD